ncbi:MAG: Flp pilus assembly complex ATPase component TadA [Candidatus Moranbacteria bacterium]|nr:Flp pilus assembly complex ATPase component TadA [Candidatus Moranbacteria bacterium]
MVKIIQQSSQNWRDEKAEKTGEVIRKLSAVSQEEEASRLAASLGLPYIDLQVFPANEEVITIIPEEEARKHRVAAFERSGSRVRVAFADPTDETAKTFVGNKAKENGLKIESYVVSAQSLEKVWHAYENAPVLESLDLWRVSLKGDDLKKFEEDFGELLKLKDSSNIPVSQTIEIVLAGANKLRASDIHIEPTETATRLRYRIDGMLQDIGTFSKDVYRLTLSRVKMLSHMKINVRDRAQDGHFSIELGDRKIDLRVNIIPGNHGENINMRILNAESVLLDIHTLGINGETYDKIMHEAQKPHGMILNTGPTGSGKTTTLYSLLHTINKPDIKIITIEDPIEYQIPGIVQTEVSKDRTYTFGSALRAVVRQDPDVVLVGEIRDEETADISVNAALTGHLLLSTIHANTAPGAIPRLIEMGVKPSLIASSINVIIGQRLVRKLCDHCKESYIPAEETTKNLKRLLSLISPKAKIDVPTQTEELWRAKGCAQCNFSGYRGRIGIFEIFSFSKRIETLILELGTEKELAKAALEDGMVTMLQDGILKALQGITTMEEVWRATGQEDFLEELYLSLSPDSLSAKSSMNATLAAEAAKASGSGDSFSEYLRSLPLEKIAQAILAGAAARKASEIHFEPGEEEATFRFRRNGALEPAGTIRTENYQAVIGEIKHLAGMPQEAKPGVREGRFSFRFGEEESGAETIDARVSVALGGYGETVMIKITGKQEEVGLDDIGLRETHLGTIRSFCRKPSGLFIVSGPDGSGKTTLLYDILISLNTPDTKIVTVEDPIERRIPGALQTQVNDAEGYSFSEAIRALLRQSPNALLISEIREREAAIAASEGALTGHLVFGSMQGNSAALAATRLSGFGIGSEDFANAGTMIAGVRLVRKLCDHCKKKTVPDGRSLELIERILSGISEKAGVVVPKTRDVFESVGCERCDGSGYSGQMMLSEILPVTRDIANTLNSSPIADDVRRIGKEEGMLTIEEDGVLAVLEGKTTLSEIERVTEE